MDFYIFDEDYNCRPVLANQIFINWNDPYEAGNSVLRKK